RDDAFPERDLRWPAALQNLGIAIFLMAGTSAHSQAVLGRSGPNHGISSRARPSAPSRTPKASAVAPALSTAPTEKPVVVTVRPNCEVTGPAFTLGEISDIKGDDKALCAALAAIEIGA